MSTTGKPRFLMVGNFVIVGFFIILYFIYKFNIDSPVVGALREMLTIPFLVAQAAYVILGIRYLAIVKDRNVLTVISVIALFICAVITLWSFF